MALITKQTHKVKFTSEGEDFEFEVGTEHQADKAAEILAWLPCCFNVRTTTERTYETE